MKIKKGEIYFALLVLFFISWTVLIYYISPESIIEKIGITNSYLIIFATCVMGGISIMFPIPYYLLVFTFAAGGGNPILLGIFAGIGLAVGDSTSYLFGYHGGKLIPKLYQKMSRKITKKIMSSPEWARNLILFTWGAVTPFPNDILIVPLGLMRYPYKKTIIPIGLGNIVFNTAVAFAGAYGFHLMGLI